MTFLLAHLSDPHIGPLPPASARELFGKRLTGWLNWHRGRHKIHSMGVLSALVADLHQQAPDHIAVTGDILNLGLASEFAPARQWLSSVGTGEHVSFVPGNHDAYTMGSMPHLARTFADWTDGAAGPNAGAGFKPYPYLKVRGEVALIGLSSGVPTAPFLASGRMGAEQGRAFAKMLDDTAAQGLCRVVMIHHPPHRAGANLGRGLSDARTFEAIIAKHGADLVLHGHNHRHAVAWLKGPTHFVPVVGVASASAVPGTPSHRAAYHVFSISKTNTGWQIDISARGLQAGSREIGPIAVPPLRPPA